MEETLSLEAGDIIRHKKYPTGPEWKVLARLKTLHGMGYLLRMADASPFCWVINDLLFRTTSGIEAGFAYDVEHWAMKRVVNDGAQQGRRDSLPA